jgi:heme exporter protein A
MLEANDLACVRGERTLFDGLTFEAKQGTLLRVAGANGSGKTSLLRIVCALLLPVRGEVRWKGEDVRALREEYWKELVYIGHMNAVKDDLTSVENLEIGAALAARPIAREPALTALELFGIAHCASLPARVLSQGQRRRVALARLAVSSACPLWVLDEPFTALDAAAVTLMQSLVSEHLGRGGTVDLTTHQEVAISAPHEARVDLGA